MTLQPVRDLPGAALVHLASEASSLAATSSSNALGLASGHLVAALPIGAAFVVAARTVLGVRTVGVFAPVLLSLGVLATGVGRGLTVIAAAVVAGLIAAPVVQRLAMPRIARLGLLLCVVCGAVQLTGASSSDRAALPLLTVAVLVERCWDTMESAGTAAGARLMCSTAALAAVVALALMAPPVVSLVSSHPGLGVVVGGALIAMAGSYRGLRLGERRRFRSLLGSELPGSELPA